MVKYQRGRIQKTFSLSLSLYLTEKKNTSVILVVGGGLVAKSCPTLVTPWTVACLEFPRQEYLSWLSFPSPDDHPNPRIESGSPAMQADFFPLSPRGKPISVCCHGFY